MCPVWHARSMPVPSSQYAVNYFPINNGGYEMWSTYNGSQYQADMVKAKSLGFNTIPVILPAKNGYLDFSSPTAAQLATLTDFYNRSVSVGITLHLTVFDHWHSYGLVSSSQAWVAAVLGALPDTANLAVIEIQNEARYASTTAYASGLDSGWPSEMTGPREVGRVAVIWAQLMTRHILSITSGVPVTASCSYGTDDLTAYVASVNAPRRPRTGMTGTAIPDPATSSTRHSRPSSASSAIRPCSTSARPA
jgi:hypothetical protein